VRFTLAVSSLIVRDAWPPVEGALRFQHAVEYRWQQHEVNKLRIELRSSRRGNDGSSRPRIAAMSVPSVVCDGVKGVCQAHDARREWDSRPAESVGVATPVPSLVMSQDASGNLGVERGQWREDLCTTYRMRGDCLALCPRELRFLVNNVEQRLVNLADVVEECHALDVELLVFIELCGIRKNKRIDRDASDVGACLGVVRVDGIEQRFERSGREALGSLPPPAFTHDEQRGCDADGEGE
jgi:hypothetical protein